MTGLDQKTIEKYVSVLEKSFIVFTLPSYSSNARNELKFSRKIYFFDNGIRNSVISRFELLGKCDDEGKLWENYIMSERYKLNAYNKTYASMFFWRTKEQKEIDLIEEREGRLAAYEFKFSPHKQPKAPIAFAKAYPDASFKVITPDNYDEFLL